MLYGGPLGTYLSGYYGPGSKAAAKSTSPASFPSATGGSTGTSTISGTGGGGSIGLNRNRGNRYRTTTPTYGTGSSGPSTISLGTSGTLAPSNSWNNFYTPQTRRKYPDDSSDTTGPSRSRYAGSGTASASTGVSGGPGHYYGASSSSVHRSSPSSAPRASPSTASSGGATYSRNSTEGSNIDYKRLYEAEKQDTQEIRGKIESTQHDLKDLKAKIDEARKSHQPGNAEQRRVERQMSEGEEQMKVLEELRASSDKLKAEHRALTRVISRLM